MDDQVAQAIREVAAAEVVPRFQALAAHEISEKSPGDLVTIADQECERVLGARLQSIRDLPIVGEESTAADPTQLDLVASASAVWVVDPIDGTANFVAGNPNFVVMVALVESGQTTAAWIWSPLKHEMLTARAGQGVNRNGVGISTPPLEATPTGIVKRKYMPEPARTRLATFDTSVGESVSALRSAGVEYGALIDGQIDFLAYWRTLPWDHAPGALVASEAGMQVARVDGTPYAPGDGNFGLLAARPELWGRIADEINSAFAA